MSNKELPPLPEIVPSARLYKDKAGMKRWDARAVASPDDVSVISVSHARTIAYDYARAALAAQPDAPSSDWPDVSPAGLRKMAEIAAPNNGAVFRAAADEIERLSAVGAAEGWKLVPVEPTPAMLVALWDHRERMTGSGENKIARIGYAAMLAAAPSPKASKPEPKAVKAHSYGGITGINDYLREDGSVVAMRPDEVVWASKPVQAEAPTKWAEQWADITTECDPANGAQRVRYSFLAERFGFMLDRYRSSILQAIAAPSVQAPEGWKLIKVERLDEIRKLCQDPSEHAYEGRGLWDNGIVHANWSKCREALELIANELNWLDTDAEDLPAIIADASQPVQAEAPSGCGHCSHGGWCGRRDCKNIAAHSPASGVVEREALLTEEEFCALQYCEQTLREIESGRARRSDETHFQDYRAATITDAKRMAGAALKRIAPVFLRLMNAAIAKQPLENEWKEAVLDQLAACSMDAPLSEPPASILKRVIAMAVQMATDPAISKQPLEQKPVAWGAIHFGGYRNGKLYNHCETEQQIDEYIEHVHQSSDSLTLSKAPLYLGPQPEQVAQDKLDADRYRWLRDNGRADGFSVEQEVPGWMRTHSATTLDAAIDAARASGQESGPA